jgi:hypothetical protein
MRRVRAVGKVQAGGIHACSITGSLCQMIAGGPIVQTIFALRI